MEATEYGWLVLAFPLLGTVLIALGWRVLPGRSSGWLASLMIFLSFLASLGMLFKVNGAEGEAGKSLVNSLFTYAETAGVSVDMSIYVDPLAIVMCLVVTGVSFLIHLYSISYMTSDKGFVRFFAYLNFFVFSMLLLVLAANFVLLIVGWAFVGAASYLLISFWYRRETATAAGIKAFVINVVGDVGLVIGAFLLFDGTGALDYATVFERAPEVFGSNDGQIVAACLMLLVGAFAKSAQLPLHTWLPDAMEGPTPVSSLIHAATMVTAGVYLIARMHPLFELAPTAQEVGAIIGAATMLFAATVALVQTDLKRIIAYSTMSQIGYMIMGVAAGAYGAGMFHLMTHAFFKALLFMGAGSVIGALGGEQSIDRMGGFRKAMPFTFVVFTIGALALAGFPLFSGFFSKDEIIAFTFNMGGLYAVLAVVGYVAALLTAFYSFRMVFRVFFGEPVKEAKDLEQGILAHGTHTNPATGEHEDTETGFPGSEHHIAEREWPMKAAMIPLAVLAVVAGIFGIPGTKFPFDLEHFLEPSFEGSELFEMHPSTGAEFVGLGIGAVIALIGIGIATSLYRNRSETPANLQARFKSLHAFLLNKWYFDELFDFTIVRPIAAFGRFGRGVIETEFVQGVLVEGTLGIVRGGTAAARGLQSGATRAYAGLLLIGVAGLLLYFLIAGA